MVKMTKPWSYILLWILLFIIIRIIGHLTPFPDTIFPKISYFFSKLLSKFSSIFPFSVGDILYTILGLTLVIYFVKIIIVIKDKKWMYLKKSLSYLFMGLSIFMFVFYFVWGFNYFKKPIKERYDVENITLDELKALANYYLEQSRNTREITQENQNGVFIFELSEEELTHEILLSAKQIQKIQEVSMIKVTVPNLKKSLYSTGFSYLGILGYYNPFTSESQFNSNMPDTKVLFTQFHEVAHQWGYAPESEANFVGFLIGIKSLNPEFNYVANYKALRSILNKIVWEDPAFVECMLEQYSPKMKRDREFEIEIQKKYLNRADDAFSVLNEAYLQLNNQDGLESYGQFVELLVGYHRKTITLKGL